MLEPFRMRFEIGDPAALVLGSINPVINLIKRHWTPVKNRPGETKGPALALLHASSSRPNDCLATAQRPLSYCLAMFLKKRLLANCLPMLADRLPGGRTPRLP